MRPCKSASWKFFKLTIVRAISRFLHAVVAMSAPDPSACLDAPRVDVNSFQKIWASLNTKATVNIHAEAIVTKLVQLDLKGAEKALNHVLESFRLSNMLSEREMQRSGIDLFGCCLMNTITYLLLRHGGWPQLRSRLEPYVKLPSHSRFVELMDVWAWQQEGVGSFVRCLSNVWCHHGMESPLVFNSELLDVACSKSLSLILFRRIVQDSSMCCAALQQCVRELAQHLPDSHKLALLNLIRMCLCSLPLIPSDLLGALLRAIRPLYLCPLPLGHFARDVLRMLGQEQQQPGSFMSFGACSAAFASGIDSAKISSMSHLFPLHPASLIFNPEARLGYYATCFLQENSPPFLNPDQLSLLYLHASAVAAASKSQSNAWATRSDVLAHAMIAAQHGSLDISEDVSSIRELCETIMSDHRVHKNSDDAVGFDLEAMYFSRLESATVSLATKVMAVSHDLDIQEGLNQLQLGAPGISDASDWPDSSNRSTIRFGLFSVV
jgi:hypothetical protein